MARVILPYIAHCCCCFPLKQGTVFLAFLILFRAILGCWNLILDKNSFIFFPSFETPDFYISLILDVVIASLAISGVSAIAKENISRLHSISRIILISSVLLLAAAILNIVLILSHRDAFVSTCVNNLSAHDYQADSDCIEYWKMALTGSVLSAVFNWLLNTYFALCLDSYRRHLEAENLRRHDLPMSDVYTPPPSPPNVTIPPPYHASPKFGSHPFRPQADLPADLQTTDLPPAYPHGEEGGPVKDDEGKLV